VPGHVPRGPIARLRRSRQRTESVRRGDGRDHRVTELPARVKADEAVAGERGEPVAQHVRHGEARPPSFRHRPRPSRQHGIAFETDDRVLDALGDRARQVTMAGADVDDPSGSRGDRQDEAPERFDLRVLARRLTRAQPRGWSTCRHEGGHRAHRARTRDERSQGARRALGPPGIESVGLYRRQLLVVQREHEGAPSSRDEGLRDLALASRTPVEHVPVLGHETCGRFPSRPDRLLAQRGDSRYLTALPR
jgi:hypothetical protein